MTPSEFRAALAAASLTQMGLSRLIGVDGRTVRRWVSGEQTIPPPVAILLRVMVEAEDGPVTGRRIREIAAGIDLPALDPAREPVE